MLKPIHTEKLVADEGTVRWHQHPLARVYGCNGAIRPEEYARLFASLPEVAQFIDSTEWTNVKGDDKKCNACQRFRDQGHSKKCAWLACAVALGVR